MRIEQFQSPNFSSDPGGSLPAYTMSVRFIIGVGGSMINIPIATGM